ncbi:uncharacterized protein LOC117585187 isoform X1 [Drosophila guanche]|uniref:Uncharacterized protein n=1 Tax=Drosophila guanche TaxID=7266 RepID=A0A3B0JQR0_DROGU|nr:uncharacterized protein LOC117585187 isoform X1 [Drosophila guanche]SPP83293.1 Hypothetical predicted protein [Drosophila guanche]
MSKTKNKNKQNETALELDAILSDPITNSHRLVAFLQRKAAEAERSRPHLVFGNVSYNLDFDVPLVKKPQKGTQEKPLKPFQELGKANASSIVAAASAPPASEVPQSPPNLASHENVPSRSARHSPSPTHRRPSTRSGTGSNVPGSDKLRRHAIQRRSRSCGRRQLLQDFEDAANLTRSSSSPFPFVPEISSTPNCSDSLNRESIPENRPAAQTKPQPEPVVRNSPNRLHQSEWESAPLEDSFVPETQPQQLDETVQNLSRRSSNVQVIPVSGAFGPKPDAAEPLPQPTSPVVSATATEAEDGAAATPTVSAGSPKSCAAGTPKSSKSKTVSPNKTPQVVVDLDAIVTDEQPSGCALNLAPAGGNTNRQSRSRTRNNQKPSDDQESSIKLLDLHRSNAASKTKRKGANAPILNKAPCTAINGEAFARELKRMSHHEILDLRKRNSLGRVYPLNGNRNHSAEQQKALEQKIQWELLQRNLEVKTETETEREEMDCMEEVMAMPPPAPVAFKDNSQRQRSGYSKERQNVRTRSRRREAPMTAELLNYMELTKTMESRRKPSCNSSKRSLYTKGDSFREDVDSLSPEKQPRLSPTRLGPTLCRARSKESLNVVEEEIFIVPPPPRSLRYSQCVRDFNGVRATPKDSNDEDTALGHLKGQKNNLSEIAAPPPEFNDDNDNAVDGSDCSSSECAVAQKRLSKSPLPPVERSKFADQSNGTATRNIRNRQSRQPPSPAKTKTTDREDQAIVSSSVPGNTSLTDEQPSTIQAALERLSGKTLAPRANEPEPEPEPEPEADARPVVAEEAVVFKKPMARAPRAKSKAKSKAKRELVNLKVSYVQDEVQVDLNEAGNRRSKRAQVPLMNTWCHTMDPMKFEWFRESVDPYNKKKSKPSTKHSSISTLSKMSLLKRPPLCSSTPRLPGEPLHAATETCEPPEPSDCSSLGLASLRWEDNERIDQVESSDARKQANKRGQPKKKRQESAAAALMPRAPVMETQTETEPQPDSVPDPIAPINAKQTKKSGRTKKKREESAAAALMPRAPVMETQTETEPQPDSAPDPIAPINAKQTKKRGRTKKKREESAAAASMPLTPGMEIQTETEPQPDSAPDPIAPINAATPSPSSSDDHQAACMQLMSWLRGHSSNQPSSNMEDCSGSRLGSTVSVASELVFNNLDDMEYAFYNTKEKATLGYMRFQPLQRRRKKLVKSVSLKFVVFFGQFALDCTVPNVAENDRRILNIGDMAEIEKGTRFGFSNLLNEVSVLMFIRN